MSPITLRSFHRLVDIPLLKRFIARGQNVVPHFSLYINRYTVEALPFGKRYGHQLKQIEAQLRTYLDEKSFERYMAPLLELDLSEV